MEVCDRECPSLYEEVNAEGGKSVLDNASCSFTYKDCKYWFSHSADSLPSVVLHRVWDDDNDEWVNSKCPEDPDFVGIILGVAAMIVMVGLVTILLWKVFTTIHDRREFARFERERQKIRFPTHSNPIFKQATTTVQNPLFNQPEK